MHPDPSDATPGEEMTPASFECHPRFPLARIGNRSIVGG